MEFILIAIVFAIIVAIFIPLLFRRVVPTNEVHIVQNAKATIAYGKDTGKGNTYYKWPTWIPLIGIEVKSLPVSIFNIELEEYEAYDKGRLQFLVDVVAFFRIADYTQAAQRVASTNELGSQLTSIVQGSVRSILAKSEIEEIMEERSLFGEKFTTEVKEQLKSWGIEAVKNIELMDVKDAPKSNVIHNIMAKKQSHIEMESRLAVAENMKLAKVAEIAATREVELNEQEAAQQVGLRTVEAEQKVAMAQETKKQTVIEQSKITTEREMEVSKIKHTKTAEIAKEVALVKATQEKEVALIEANQQKEVEVLNANKVKETGIIKAEADFQVKTKQAEADFEVKTKQADADATSTKKRAEASLDVQLKNAEGLAAEGKAKAEAEAALLMAPVSAQIAQAKEIGSNKEYQQYLITIEQVKASAEVGKAQAKALEAANIKVIANSGSAGDGLKSVGEILSSKGGTQIGAMLEGLANTDMGKALVDKFLTSKE